jgi:hypothetical protein
MGIEAPQRGTIAWTEMVAGNLLAHFGVEKSKLNREYAETLIQTTFNIGMDEARELCESDDDKTAIFHHMLIDGETHNPIGLPDFGDDPCHGPEDTTCPSCGLGN